MLLSIFKPFNLNCHGVIAFVWQLTNALNPIK